MSDFKSKIFEPLDNRVAQKILENEHRQSDNFLVLMEIVLWNRHGKSEKFSAIPFCETSVFPQKYLNILSI